MSIKISSKNIFEMKNSKYIDNEINKVTFEEKKYATSVVSPNPEKTENDENFKTTEKYSPYAIFTNTLHNQILIRCRSKFTGTFSKRTLYFSKEEELIIGETTLSALITTEGAYDDKNFNNEATTGITPFDTTSLVFDEIPVPVWRNTEESAISYGEQIRDFSLSQFKGKVFFNAYEDTDYYRVEIAYLSSISTDMEIGRKGVHEEDWSTEIVKENVYQLNVTEIITSVSSTSRRFEVQSKVVTGDGATEFKTFALPTNELVIEASETNGLVYPIGEYLGKSIIDDYLYGKETATILCSISKYYDENGNIVINPIEKDGNPMTFSIGDIVIPYIYNKNGEIPMSVNYGGFAKQFKVTKVTLRQLGVLRQELTLQEISANE